MDSGRPRRSLLPLLAASVLASEAKEFPNPRRGSAPTTHSARTLAEKKARRAKRKQRRAG